MSPLKSSPARARCQWMYAIPTQSGVMGNAAVGAGQRCLTFMLDKECFQGMLGSHIIADMTNPRLKNTLQYSIRKCFDQYFYIINVSKGHVKCGRGHSLWWMDSTLQSFSSLFSLVILLPITSLLWLSLAASINPNPQKAAAVEKVKKALRTDSTLPAHCRTAERHS